MSDATTPTVKKRGRKAGWRKAPVMANNKINSSSIYDLVPEDTIPYLDRPRFLKLCDTWIEDLDPELLKKTDLEEIALYARERIYIDNMYKTFAEAQGIMDPNLINQLDKMNKTLESRKENLGSRFKDRGVSRKDKGKFSFSDLFSKFVDNPGTVASESKSLIENLIRVKQNYTDTLSYMDSQASGPRKEEVED